MSMRVTFELSKKDVGHFHDCMDKAREAVRDAEEHEIIDAVSGLFCSPAGQSRPAVDILTSYPEDGFFQRFKRG